MNFKVGKGRFLLMFLALLSLITGIYAGLARFSWIFPYGFYWLPFAHGPLVVCGFLGTLISLERAIVIRYRWTFLAPALSGLGALTLLIGPPFSIGAFLVTSGSAVLVAMMTLLILKHRNLPMIVMGLGAFSFFVGNILWLNLALKAGTAGSLFPSLYWWMGFPLLTIAGERLELARIGPLSPGALKVFLLSLFLYILGCIVERWHWYYRTICAGLGMVMLACWLFWKDIARHTVRTAGMHRFIAIAILAGYFWLAVAGILTLFYDGVFAGPAYDAIAHSLFLGFVFSMIFAHMPLVFSSVSGKQVQFQNAFYIHLALLHFSLLLRIFGDVIDWTAGIRWGGLLNAAALLIFLFNTAISVRK